jgi:hypothetical protein
MQDERTADPERRSYLLRKAEQLGSPGTGVLRFSGRYRNRPDRCGDPVCPRHADQHGAAGTRAAETSATGGYEFLNLLPGNYPIDAILGQPTQDYVLGNFQPSLRDYSLAHANPGLTSWATLSRPCGTDS